MVVMVTSVILEMTEPVWEMLVREFMLVNISPGLTLMVRLRPREQDQGAFSQGPLVDRTTLGPSPLYLCMLPGTDPGLPLTLTHERVFDLELLNVPLSTVNLKAVHQFLV